MKATAQSMTASTDLAEIHRPEFSRPRTGHCQLYAHIHRMGLTDSATCSCGAPKQTPNNIPARCSDLSRCKEYSGQMPFETSCGEPVKVSQAHDPVHDPWRNLLFVIYLSKKHWLSTNSHQSLLYFGVWQFHLFVSLCFCCLVGSCKRTFW